MTGTDGSAMTNSEILAVSKILLESRAFSKKEMDSLLSKLVEGCVPLRNMKLVSDLIANEKYHYVELTHPSYDRDSLWNLGVAIRNHNLLEISYHKGICMRHHHSVVRPLFCPYCHKPYCVDFFGRCVHCKRIMPVF